MFDAKDGVTSFNEACCCGSTSEVLSVSEFEVSQSDRKRITNVLQSFSSDFIVAPLNNLVCNVTSVVHYDIHPPLEKTSVLYRHQQLRL